MGRVFLAHRRERPHALKTPLPSRPESGDPLCVAQGVFEAERNPLETHVGGEAEKPFSEAETTHSEAEQTTFFSEAEQTTI